MKPSFGKILPFFFILFVFVGAYKKDYGFGFMFKYEPNFKQRQEAEASLVDQFRSVMNFYKRHEDGPFVNDPLPIHTFHRKFSGNEISFENSSLYGLSRFRLDSFETDLENLRVSMKLSMPQLLLNGRYMLSTWVSTTKGDFNVTISDVEFKVNGEFVIDEEGFLQIGQMKNDLNFGDLKMYFEKLGFMRSVLQEIMNKVGVFVFENIKPTISEEIEVKLKNIIDSEAKTIPQQFPNAINPIDRTLVHLRKLIKLNALDPVPLADYTTQRSKWSKFELYNGNLHGLSNIRRNGPILVGFDQNTIHMTIHLGLENLPGTYNWMWTAYRGVLGRRGQVEFSLENVDVEIRLEQSKNLGTKPVVNSVNITLGPTHLSSDGIGGAVGYILEMIFNVVPNVFRQRITDAAEHPLTTALETELQKINIESFVEESSS